MSSLLFYVYVHSLYARVAEQADVTLYCFIDDLQIVGKPSEAVEMFSALRSLVLEVRSAGQHRQLTLRVLSLRRRTTSHTLDAHHSGTAQHRDVRAVPRSDGRGR